MRTEVSRAVRAVNTEERTIDVIASTFGKDSYNTRIDQDGWDLAVFKTNPVILWGHDDRGYTGSNGMPVAKAENVRVENGRLMMTLRFPSKETDEFAHKV